MPVITMKIPCVVQAKAGNDVYGQPIWGAERKTVCAVIKLLQKRQKSTVRADSSGTRGHADEAIVAAHFLMKKTEAINIDDFVTIHGVRVRVMSIFPRHDVNGRLDHLELEGTHE